MIKISDIKVEISCKLSLKQIVANYLNIDQAEVLDVIILKRSLDARKKPMLSFVYTFACSLSDETSFEDKKFELNKSDYEIEVIEADKDIQPIVIGCGPSGLFCALQLAKCGLKPIIIERGKPVKERQQDIDKLLTKNNLIKNSNILFGAGGAGTFSDGKLNTGIKSPLIKKVLRQFVKCGAPDEIEYVAKPHIGSDNLAVVVENFCNEIIALGGQIVYNTTVTNFIIENDKCIGVVCNCSEQEKSFFGNAFILATGHSARDTYEQLNKLKVEMQPKPFSMGVRVEHPKELINLSQYGKEEVDGLKSADYKLVEHLQNGRTVYTFCMCPGGVVVPAMSEDNAININGMSYFARNEKKSNSAVLVNINVDDFYKDNVLDGIYLQQKYEKMAYELVNSGNKTHFAPCQTLKDFKNGIISNASDLLSASYKPGVKPANLKECLPNFVYESIKQSFDLFSKKIKNFNIDNALLTGIETRSSSPVRIVRNVCGQSNIKNIYPVGEGAGYAGGIVSASVDGLMAGINVINNFKE